MTASVAGKLSWTTRLTAEARRDPKKVVVLGALVLVLVIVVGREVVNRMGPSPASGAEAGAAASSHRQHTSAAGPALRDAADAVAASGSEELAAVLPRPVDRDLFSPPLEYYPARKAPKPRAVPEPTGPTEAELEQARRRRIASRANSLTLQSTVIGSVPTAIVNGRVLRKGDEIGGFRVVGIGVRSCTIEREDVRVVLEMAQ